MSHPYAKTWEPDAPEKIPELISEDARSVEDQLADLLPKAPWDEPKFLNRVRADFDKHYKRSLHEGGH